MRIYKAKNLITNYLQTCKTYKALPMITITKQFNLVRKLKNNKELM